MTESMLTLRALNRATLARQMLLERAELAVPAAIDRLGGLQAQLPISPYLSLWTRLHGFQRASLANLIENREVVKATYLRATLHLVTSADFARTRAVLQPALTQGWKAILRQRKADFDFERLLAAAREYIAEKPRTFAEISAMVAGLMPEYDVGAMRYAIRTHLALVQVPVTGGWSYPGNPAFTLAESWTGLPISPAGDLRELVRHYLAAYGPASPADMQTWCGLAGLKETFEQLRPELLSCRDERRREIFDLPGLPQPPGDSPAPVRFLPEYDNLLLSHSVRTRVIPDVYHKQVFLSGLRVRATILVDGFVRGGWQVEKAKNTATLVIEPFAPLTAAEKDALAAEGEALVRFVEAGAGAYAVRFAQ